AHQRLVARDENVPLRQVIFVVEADSTEVGHGRLVGLTGEAPLPNIERRPPTQNVGGLQKAPIMRLSGQFRCRAPCSQEISVPSRIAHFGAMQPARLPAVTAWRP